MVLNKRYQALPFDQRQRLKTTLEGDSAHVPQGFKERIELAKLRR